MTKIDPCDLVRKHKVENPFKEVDRAKVTNPYEEEESLITDEEKKKLTFPEYVRKNNIVRDEKVGIKEKFKPLPYISSNEKYTEFSKQYYSDLKRITTQRLHIRWFDVGLTKKWNMGHRFSNAKKYEI